MQERTLHLIFLSDHASSHPSNKSSNASQFSLIIMNLRSNIGLEKKTMQMLNHCFSVDPLLDGPLKELVSISTNYTHNISFNLFYLGIAVTIWKNDADTNTTNM